jgi:hypothetical protein
MMTQMEIKFFSKTVGFQVRGVKLLASVDISARAPKIMQNEQHFVTG